jgi:hypothetical protein
MGQLSDRWSKADLELQLYDAQIENLTDTTAFKKIASGTAAKIADEKTPLFRNQSRELFLELFDLEDLGGRMQKEKKGQIKKAVIDLIHNAFKESQKVKRVKLDSDKVYIKSFEDDKDKEYEISFVTHRKAPILDTENIKLTVPARGPMKFLSDVIGSSYTMLDIKNTGIVILYEDKQYTIKLTKKVGAF